MATEWPHFSHTPIIEALLDIRTEARNIKDLPALASMQDAIRERFPKQRKHFSWQGNLKFDTETVKLSKSGGQDGYLFYSTDGREIVQARLNGFTYNRLKPYNSWTAFREEAARQWTQYREMAAPVLVNKLGLRYINAIELPVGVDFKEHLLTVPEIAPGLPQSLENFLVRLIIPMPQFNCKAVVTETLKPIKNPTTNEIDKQRFQFIFDIDVFRQAVYKPDSLEIWETFDALRNAKNEVFFQSLTEKAKEHFT